MLKIYKKIEEINNKNEKVLSVFLTAGYPDRENFVELALGVLDAGADMLEIGIPFSDPLAITPTSSPFVLKTESLTSLPSGTANLIVVEGLNGFG